MSPRLFRTRESGDTADGLRFARRVRVRVVYPIEVRKIGLTRVFFGLRLTTGSKSDVTYLSRRASRPNVAVVSLPRVRGNTDFEPSRRFCPRFWTSTNGRDRECYTHQLIITFTRYSTGKTRMRKTNYKKLFVRSVLTLNVQSSA